MMYLGPTGRTKNTEDVPEVHTKPASPTTVAVMEVRRLRMIVGLLQWSLIALFAGLALWVGVAALIDHMGQPEQDRRIRACAEAMQREEDLRGPLEPCESLSPAERRSAAYEYTRMKGLW